MLYNYKSNDLNPVSVELELSCCFPVLLVEDRILLLNSLEVCVLEESLVRSIASVLVTCDEVCILSDNRNCRDIVVSLDTCTSRDEGTDDNVLLDTCEVVCPALDDCVCEDLCSLLEGCCSHEGISSGSSLGDTEEDDVALCGCKTLLLAVSVLGDEVILVNSSTCHEACVARFIDLDTSHHLLCNDLDVLVVDVNTTA